MSDAEPRAFGEISALLGRGTEYEGTLVFEGRIRIDGRFRGTIRGEDVLVLGDGADVDAVVDVGTVIVCGGVLKGSVRATRLVELHAPSRVLADIESPQLYIDRGVVFEGRCTMPGAKVEPMPVGDGETDARG